MLLLVRKCLLTWKLCLELKVTSSVMLSEKISAKYYDYLQYSYFQVFTICNNSRVWSVLLVSVLCRVHHIVCCKLMLYMSCFRALLNFMC